MSLCNHCVSKTECKTIKIQIYIIILTRQLRSKIFIQTDKKVVGIWMLAFGFVYHVIANKCEAISLPPHRHCDREVRSGKQSAYP